MQISEITAVVALFAFPAAMVFAAFFDLFTLRIPNLLVMLLLGAFGISALGAGMELTAFASHVGVAFGVLVAGFFAFSRGWMGAGDAKLMAVTALWFGPSQIFAYIMLGGLMGGALTFAVLALRQTDLPESLLRVTWLARLADARTGVPYAMALGPAGLVLFSASPWVGSANGLASSLL